MNLITVFEFAVRWGRTNDRHGEELLNEVHESPKHVGQNTNKK